MKIGFTGTRKGMTRRQKRQFEGIIQKLGPAEFHHGDCIGADSDAHEIINHINVHPLDIFKNAIIIVVHPPTHDKLRAHRKGHTILEPKPYLERNEDIVEETDLLIATPESSEEQARRGTWHTVRQARKMNKPIIILNP